MDAPYFILMGELWGMYYMSLIFDLFSTLIIGVLCAIACYIRPDFWELLWLGGLISQMVYKLLIQILYKYIWVINNFIAY